MTLTQIKPKLYHVEFDAKYRLILAMVRMQVFYESQYKEIRGKVFTLEDLIACTMRDSGMFSYFEDVVACNVPGDVVQDFFDAYGMKLNKRERALRELLPKMNGAYLIATAEGSDSLDHEIAHGFYYLNKKYRRSMDAITTDLPDKDSLTVALIKLGYSADLVDDEIQAYLATTQLSELPTLFPDFDIDYGYISQYRHVFEAAYA